MEEKFLKEPERSEMVRKCAERILSNLDKMTPEQKQEYMQQVVTRLTDARLMAFNFAIEMTPNA